LLQGSPHRPDHENRGSDAGSVYDVDAPRGQPHPARVRVTGDFSLRHGSCTARVRECNAYGLARRAHGDRNRRVVGNKDADPNSIRSAHVDSHTEPNPDIHPHAHVDALSDRDVHGESDTDFNPNPDLDGDGNGHRAASPHPDADGHGHADTDGHAAADSDAHRHCGADPYAEADRYAEAN
jgi:hypothetical protein